MPRALKAGFDTYWTSYGQGPHAALMVHCSLASSEAWGPLARHLSGALTMTAFDMPGHGRSAAWDDRGEIQGVTAEIAADFLSKPAHVVGHSFGATVALRLAVERPEMVRTLTLIEPVIFAIAIADQPVAAEKHAIQSAEFEDAMMAGDTFQAARAFTRLWGDGTPWKVIAPDRQKLLASQMHLVAAGIPALYDDVAGILNPGRLGRAAMPTLLIEGSASPQIVNAINTGLAQRLPDTHRTVIAGARHMAPITHAAAVGAEILRFLTVSSASR